MSVGINSISIYIPGYYISHDELAEARDIPKDKYRIGLGNFNMAIAPPWEDTVTMAANAGAMAIEAAGINKDDIGLVIVSTETSVDQSKPVASFVQGLLNIGPHARVYEIKHACYAATAGIMNAVNWIQSGLNNGKKALVIASDIAKYGLRSLGEPTQGAGAIGIILSDNPEYIQFLPEYNAFYSEDVNDFWRPNESLVPIVDGKYSIECYLKAFTQCLEEVLKRQSKDGLKGIDGYADHYLYHIPFTRMAYKAHHKFLEIIHPDKKEDEISGLCDLEYENRLKPSLMGAEQVGNIYTGSVYMCLISLLENGGKNIANKIISLFSYGSGCASELFFIKTGNNIDNLIAKINFLEQISSRKKLFIDEYEKLYSTSNMINYDQIIDAYPPGNFSRYIYKGTVNNKRTYERYR